MSFLPCVPARVPGLAMDDKADALIIGAGPAGAATAILLAQAGWKVILAEQKHFPRQKVCGECISAGSLPLLDALGVGTEFRHTAGPELRRVGWIGRGAMIAADFPPCCGPYAYGRAMGRDRLDELLLQRARSLGVSVLQPVKVRRVSGRPGEFDCEMERRVRRENLRQPPALEFRCRARVVIDAHGSWETGPHVAADGESDGTRPPSKASDLFAFKARYLRSGLEPGLLPVVVFPGGYGGMVVADGGRTTLACCIRRDTLHACRAALPGAPASEAISSYLWQSCPGLRQLTDAAPLDTGWLSVGPIRPGIRVGNGRDVFRVGNAAGETHPLIGEGISMALQAAGLLVSCLRRCSPGRLDVRHTHDLNRRYAALWRAAFTSRLRSAAGYAQAAMRPVLTAPAEDLLQRWPFLLTRAARWAGKARGSAVRPVPTETLA